MSGSRHDYAIVGGGIAGLAIAEALARSGFDVLLVERNEKLCQEASASHHGWFHFGSLYSIFPQNQFLRTMVGGVEDLLDHYAGFPGLNIAITPEGRLAFPQTKGAWFRDEPIEYIVSARNDPDFDMRSFESVSAYARKVFFLMTWELAIKQFISRHQRFHKHDWSGGVAASQWIPRAGFADYSREVITKPDHPGINLDINTHFRIVGYDRPMRSAAIVTDLVRSFIGAGGTIEVGAEIEHVERLGQGARLTTAGGRRIEAANVVFAAGKWLGRFLSRQEDVKVVASPLLVAWPAVADHHFVRMTPFVDRSVNHLHHEIGGRRYSVIGGGYFANPKDEAAVAHATEKLVEMARRVFPALADARIIETYQGYKTEIVAHSGERNYQYFIRQVGDGIHVVVPGKFSLAFSLAVNTVRRLTGKTLPREVKLANAEAAQPYVGIARHAAFVAPEPVAAAPVAA
ncbi:NAD(P)/FAD-dependent oxidoreductase [Rhodomicrobium lacus]|uniref:NAD(P)/FAD-dependent oxidoreductase n=1 Tax=Rhodomicrobium lacus TaxID=2498452 RepID=UPI000F8D36B0|nr:FAD-dependent oxidoreductase [Rhodomicrobium lacus]